MSEAKVFLEYKDKIAIVTLNNPPVNALDAQVIDEIEKAFDKLYAKKDVLAVVVTGAGDKAFVAGADITQFPSLRRQTGIELVRRGQLVYEKIANFPAPVICAVNGFAFGGGLELALACDIRVISENAKVGLPEVTLGIYPGYGGTQRLPRAVGLGMAKKLIFTGAPIDAAEAYRIGLADQLVPSGKSLEEAVKLAEVIATRGPVAVRTVKKVINQGIELNIGDAILLEAQEFGGLCETEDKNEGAKAFMEKRKPNFQGK